MVSKLLGLEIPRGFIIWLDKFNQVAGNKICFIKVDKQLFMEKSITTSRKLRVIEWLYNFYNE